MVIVPSILKLNSVSTVTATAENGVFILHCNITDLDGNTYDADYCSHPEDTFGLNPIVRQWLADNPSFPISSYIAPTAEATRASMLSLTARQLRLGLLNAGISPTQVTAAIDDMPAGVDKDKTHIEWEYAATFSRLHPVIATIGAALDRTDEQIDAMWAEAVKF